MQESKIKINDKEYIAYILTSEEEKVQGLSNIESIDDNEVFLFDYSNDMQEELTFNTVDMDFPIDIIFVNDDDEVVAVEYGEPKSEDVVTCVADPGEMLKYVIEINVNSGISIGDEVDFEDDDVSDDEVDKMYIIGPDGNPQMDLLGGERIFSRKNTKTLIRMAKRANKSKNDSDYARLGRKMFKYIYIQDHQNQEYVDSPK